MSSPPDSTSEATASGAPQQRQSNLQRIQQRKAAVKSWPLEISAYFAWL